MILPPILIGYIENIYIFVPSFIINLKNYNYEKSDVNYGGCSFGRFNFFS